MTRLHHYDDRRKPPPLDRDDLILEELRAQNAKITAQNAQIARLVQLFDHFAGTFLNARFQFGRPTDRWARRS